ncbi:MAG: hypothetical protein U0795_27125 [Pirellulales bacterium]
MNFYRVAVFAFSAWAIQCQVAMAADADPSVYAEAHQENIDRLERLACDYTVCISQVSSQSEMDRVIASGECSGIKHACTLRTWGKGDLFTQVTEAPTASSKTDAKVAGGATLSFDGEPASVNVFRGAGLRLATESSLGVLSADTVGHSAELFSPLAMGMTGTSKDSWLYERIQAGVEQGRCTARIGRADGLIEIRYTGDSSQSSGIIWLLDPDRGYLAKEVTAYGQAASGSTTTVQAKMLAAKQLENGGWYPIHVIRLDSPDVPWGDGPKQLVNIVATNATTVLDHTMCRLMLPKGLTIQEGGGRGRLTLIKPFELTADNIGTLKESVVRSTQGTTPRWYRGVAALVLATLTAIAVVIWKVHKGRR